MQNQSICCSSKNIEPVHFWTGSTTGIIFSPFPSFAFGREYTHRSVAGSQPSSDPVAFCIQLSILRGHRRNPLRWLLQCRSAYHSRHPGKLRYEWHLQRIHLPGKSSNFCLCNAKVQMQRCIGRCNAWWICVAFSIFRPPLYHNACALPKLSAQSGREFFVCSEKYR